MQQLILIRGLPGTGKSTRAKKLEGFCHVEADMFFTGEDGQYHFNQADLRDAHQWCRLETKRLLTTGSNVVVTNTFTQLWEMQPYLELAGDLKIKVVIIELNKMFNNIHNVPDYVLGNMRLRWHDEELIMKTLSRYEVEYRVG